MKTLPIDLLIGFLTLVLSCPSPAEVLRWPQVCTVGELQIKNLKQTELRVWLQKFKPTLISETELNLKPQSMMRYALTNTSTNERYTLLNLNDPGSIEVQFSCNQKNYPAHSFEGGLLTYRRSDLSQNEIWIQNLYSETNTITVEVQDRHFKTLSTVIFSIKPSMKANYRVPEKTSLSFPTWKYLKISASSRFAAFNLNSMGADGPFLVNPQPSRVDTKASYFLVESRFGGGDTYIAKITKPALIEKAREQMAHPELDKILFAKVQKGSAGYNRNWSKTEKSFWSWSISEVTGFNDIGSTSCNGFPQALEDRIDEWVKYPGQICFWSFRIKKEFSAADIANGVLLNPGP